MGKRRRACVLDWNVVPPEGADAAEKKAAEQLGELLTEGSDFEDMVFDLTDAIGKGYACLELEWHRVEGLWVPKTITHRPQTWFTLNRGYRQELRLRTNAVSASRPGPCRATPSRPSAGSRMCTRPRAALPGALRTVPPAGVVLPVQELQCG